MTRYDSFSQTIKIALAALALAATAGCAAQAGSSGDAAFDPTREVTTPAQQLDFQNINPAIRMATAWGDKGASAHGTFGKFPGEFITPFHTHSGAYHGIVVQGVMTNPFVGEENPPKMGAGSYWHVPAGSVHATACVSAEPCQFYFHSDGPFDFQPVE
jgi:hypothetical protein